MGKEKRKSNEPSTAGEHLKPDLLMKKCIGTNCKRHKNIIIKVPALPRLLRELTEIIGMCNSLMLTEKKIEAKNRGGKSVAEFVQFAKLFRSAAELM